MFQTVSVVALGIRGPLEYLQKYDPYQEFIILWGGESILLQYSLYKRIPHTVKL